MSDLAIKIALVLAALAIGIGSRYIPGFKNDNPVEQAAEKVIKDETGADIDLSPE